METLLSLGVENLFPISLTLAMLAAWWYAF